MDWRVVVAGLTLSAGFVLDWLQSGSFDGAVVSAILVMSCLISSVLIDKYVYKL
jgi:hypothetical protein